eukprot:jgi/Galph1/1722/GphlegSOOS_G398.1
MTKRKLSIFNPLSFTKRETVSCHFEVPKVYRWIAFNGDEVTVDVENELVSTENNTLSINKEELKRVWKLTQQEFEWRKKGYQVLVGVDEAGRGPLAGPVVAAACILPADILFEGLNDSKKLSPTHRAQLFQNIQKYALEYSIGQVDQQTIDEVNIFQATMMAVQFALKNLHKKPQLVLADGPHWKLSLDIPLIAVTKGDSSISSISAASILAKETRDRRMVEAHKEYPQYGFDKHKGYGTAGHLVCLKRYGPCSFHRMSFRPICQSKNGTTTCQSLTAKKQRNRKQTP